MSDDAINAELHHRDHESGNKWSWGRDYGKDILVDLNMLAHAKGTTALMRDGLQRAYKEIVKLRRADGP